MSGGGNVFSRGNIASVLGGPAAGFVHNNYVDPNGRGTRQNFENAINPISRAVNGDRSQLQNMRNGVGDVAGAVGLGGWYNRFFGEGDQHVDFSRIFQNNYHPEGEEQQQAADAAAAAADSAVRNAPLPPLFPGQPATGGTPGGMPGSFQGNGSYQPSPVQMPSLLPNPQTKPGGMPLTRDTAFQQVMAPLGQQNWGVPQVNPSYMTGINPVAGGKLPAGSIQSGGMDQAAVMPYGQEMMGQGLGMAPRRGFR